MKTILSLLLLMSSFAYADTSAIERFIFDGSMDSKVVNMTTEKTRTEYRQVPVRTTCYRTEYRQRCEMRPQPCRQVCRQGVCRNVCPPPVRRCHQVPVSIPYPCTRIETRAFEVHDYYVETTATFDFAEVVDNARVNEEISIGMKGEISSLSAKGSKNYFIMLDSSSRSESRGNGVKYVDLNYKVRLVSAVNARNVLSNGIQNVKLRSGILSFNLGAGFNLEDFSQQIRLFQNRRLGSDILILDRDLALNDMNVISTTNSSNITIDLNSLGVNVPSKLRVILDTKFMIDENKILNKNEVSTSANSNWVFR